MNKFIFLAHDPGGYDVIYPVALQLSRCENTDVAVYLSGPAGDKLPLLKKSDQYILNKLENFILAGEKPRGDDDPQPRALEQAGAQRLNLKRLNYVRLMAFRRFPYWIIGPIIRNVLNFVESIFFQIIIF